MNFELRPQTIQIYLPSGDVDRIRIAELTTGTIRLIEVPLVELADFLKMAEANQVGIYFLVGDDAESGRAMVYVGQSGTIATRLKGHQRNKPFWKRAYIAVSRTNALTSAHVLFLEWYAIECARKASRYLLENGNAGSRPYLPAPLEADCIAIHREISLLLSTLSFPLYRVLVPNTSSSQGVHSPRSSGLLLCNGATAKAEGHFTSEGMVVLAGSLARADVTASAIDASFTRHRQRLIDEGVMVKEADGRYRFTRDELFTSPSRAASILQGRHSNGLLDWRSPEGTPLAELIAVG